MQIDLQDYLDLCADLRDLGVTVVGYSHSARNVINRSPDNSLDIQLNRNKLPLQRSDGSFSICV